MHDVGKRGHRRKTLKKITGTGSPQIALVLAFCLRGHLLLSKILCDSCLGATLWLYCSILYKRKALLCTLLDHRHIMVVDCHNIIIVWLIMAKGVSVSGCHFASALLVCDSRVVVPPCWESASPLYCIIRDETFIGNSMPVESDYKLPVGFLGKW